jgi:methanogenic corrinoid protein MtbC1
MGLGHICTDCAGKILNISDEAFARIKKLQAIQKIILEAGLSQDKKTAYNAIDLARSEGVQTIDLLMGVVSPLLWKIGDMWAAGTITVRDEHRFTAFINTILERIENDDLTKIPINNQKNIDILLMNAPRNTHFLGVRVLNLWLQSKGVRSLVIQSKSNISMIFSKIESLNPKFIGVSAALENQIPATLKLYEKIQSQFPNRCPSFVIGGNSVKQGIYKSQPGVTFLFDLKQLLKLIRAN